MSEDTTFADFIRRIRAGDDRAAQELVERYEPVIRREVRLRLCEVEAAGIATTSRFPQATFAITFANQRRPLVENSSKPRDQNAGPRRSGHRVAVPGGADRARDTGARPVRERTP
jgi:hypothetical protein